MAQDIEFETRQASPSPHNLGIELRNDGDVVVNGETVTRDMDLYEKMRRLVANGVPGKIGGSMKFMAGQDEAGKPGRHLVFVYSGEPNARLRITPRGFVIHRRDGALGPGEAAIRVGSYTPYRTEVYAALRQWADDVTAHGGPVTISSADPPADVVIAPAILPNA